MTPKFDVF